MKCRGSVASNIESTFVTVEQLIDAIEGDDDLTDIDGIGPKTSETIMDWYENRFDREESAQETSVKRTSSKSLSIQFLGSWEDAIGGDDE